MLDTIDIDTAVARIVADLLDAPDLIEAIAHRHIDPTLAALAMLDPRNT